MDENGIIGTMNPDNWFSDPSGVAWEMGKLLFGKWLETDLTDVTLLSYIAGYANPIAFLIASWMIGFSIVFSVMKVNESGKLSATKMSPFSILLSVLVVGLIQPVFQPVFGENPAGLSNIQLIVGRLIFGTANNIADEPAGFAMANSTNTMISLPDSSAGFNAMKDMVNMAFCTRALNIGIDDYQDYKGMMYAYSNQRQTDLGTAVNETLAKSANGLDTDLLNVTSNIKMGQNGNCGMITMPDLGEMSYLEKPILNLQIKTLSRIMSEVVIPVDSEEGWYSSYDMASAIETGTNGVKIKNDVINSANKLIGIQRSYDSELKNIIVEGINANYEATHPDMQLINNNGNMYVSVDPEKFNDKYGWMMLGGYYMLLGNSINNITSSIAVATDNTSFNFDAEKGCLMTNDSWKWNPFKDEEDCGTRGYDDIFNKSTYVLKTASDFLANSDGSARVASEASCNDVSCPSDKATLKNVSRMVASPLLATKGDFGTTLAKGTFSVLGSGFGLADENTYDANDYGNGTAISAGATALPDPIGIVQTMGHSIMYTTFFARQVTFVLDSVASGLENSLLSQVGIGGLMGGFIGSVSDYLKGWITVLQGSGAVMAYYIPILPGIIAGFTSLNYMVIFAEAMFFAPLGLAMLASPEGSGLAGSNWQRNLGMGMTLLLRPFMIVVGILLSRFILAVGWIFMNEIFWMSVGQSEFWTFDIMKVACITGIYLTFITTFMHNTFKLITTVPDDFDRWLFAGITNTFGNNGDNAAVDKMVNTSPSTSTGTNSQMGHSLGAGIGNAIGGAPGKVRSMWKGKDSDNSRE
ncbi:DotA/TraY family protein [Salinicola aestuarinus]|uniref:DotA/TraY family protein n=1 Tax=Salinicola aestuarinus TaxID=1949082 RepID=UPI000DA1E064|nr:DotA/TraY family protein [Salinicola aestuarinus]